MADQVDIRAIKTRYNGYRFRSRLEARWAVFFDKLGLRYVYEAEGFHLPSGAYLPDFTLPSISECLIAEIKPITLLPDEQFEFAFSDSYPVQDGALPRELVLGIELVRAQPNILFACYYGDPFDVLSEGDGGAVWYSERRGLRAFRGFILPTHRQKMDLREAAKAARGARFEHGERG